ncbi:MAG: F0F1 ATP synthase subunit B [Bacteroidales bacterium]|nr:F0F1 ATP synthase subunit B [Bacteroidales bacterium]MBO4566477.1 F0F1 ATP synthase subunit B [Bacteroidales bacterium]
MSLITPDIGLLFWMVIIFGAVFFVLAKWGFPLITRMVEKRSDYIRDSLAEAEKARLSLETLSAEQQKLIEQTRAEQSRILAEASRTREEIVTGAKEEAAAESAKILGKAREEIKAEKEAALAEIRSEVSALSVAVAEKILRKELSPDAEQLALIDRLADEASKAPLN